MGRNILLTYRAREIKVVGIGAVGIIVDEKMLDFAHNPSNKLGLFVKLNRVRIGRIVVRGTESPESQSGAPTVCRRLQGLQNRPMPDNCTNRWVHECIDVVRGRTSVSRQT